MSSGKLAAVTINAGVNTLIYTVPRSMVFTATINVCNRNDSDVKVRLAYTDRGLSSLTDADYFEYDVVVRANGVIERSGIEMAPEQSIIGYSDTANVNFQVWE